MGTVLLLLPVRDDEAVGEEDGAVGAGAVEEDGVVLEGVAEEEERRPCLEEDEEDEGVELFWPMAEALSESVVRMLRRNDAGLD